MATTFQTVFTWVQFLVLAVICTKAIRVLQFYLLYSSDLSQYKPTSGKPWALVTGASDGIGKGFAGELCRRGFNVIIHGRNEKKLQGVKAELEKEFPSREIRLLVLDAVETAWSENTDAIVLGAVKGLNLTVLINNVGGGAGIKPDFATVTERSAKDMDVWINVNLRFMTQITRVLIPTLSRDKSQRTVICNISSGAELLPAPYLVVYSATKAYVSRWSLSLDSELRMLGHNMDTHSYIVGNVVTAGSGRDESMVGLFSPNARTYASAALSKLGSGHVVCTPYWPHGLQVGFMTSVPSWVGASFVSLPSPIEAIS